MSATHDLTEATRQLLKKYAKSSASLSVHLYSTHFRFGHQPGLFLRDSPAWSFLSCLRDQRLPEDLRELLTVQRGQSAVTFYDGCLLVELHDHRQKDVAAAAPQLKGQEHLYPMRHLDQELHSAKTAVSATDHPPEKVCRIVLWPQEGSLAAEISRLVSDPTTALAVEARVLALTHPTLCLDPNPLVSSVANAAWSATMPRPHREPVQAKRKKDDDNQESVKEKRMRLMDEGYGRSFTPTFSRLALAQSIREKLASERQAASPAPVAAPAPPPQPVQQQQRPQHPLAQAHFPVAAAAAAAAQSSQPNRNASLSVTIPPRKNSSNAPSPAASTSAPLPPLPAAPLAASVNSKKKQNKSGNTKLKASQSKQKKKGGVKDSPSQASTPQADSGPPWPTY